MYTALYLLTYLLTPLVDQQFGYAASLLGLAAFAGISTKFSEAITTQFCFTYTLEGVHCYATRATR